MSFILDALKKAEAERQRQAGPTLLEVRVTRPRRRFPLWIAVLGALLLLNLGLLMFFMLRRPASESPTAPSVDRASVQPAAPPSPPVASTAAAASVVAPPAAAAAAPAAPAAPAAAGSVAPMPAEPAAAPASAPGSSALSDDAEDNPADDEPALSPARAGAAHRREPPNLADIGGDLPQLRLDLHVYALRPADRYALINMHRVHEGDVLPEGPRVLAIDRDGVELSYRGTEFMLHPQ